MLIGPHIFWSEELLQIKYSVRKKEICMVGLIMINNE